MTQETTEEAAAATASVDETPEYLRNHFAKRQAFADAVIARIKVQGGQMNLTQTFFDGMFLSDAVEILVDELAVKHGLDKQALYDRMTAKLEQSTAAVIADTAKIEVVKATPRIALPTGDRSLNGKFRNPSMNGKFRKN